MYRSIQDLIADARDADLDFECDREEVDRLWERVRRIVGDGRYERIRNGYTVMLSDIGQQQVDRVLSL